MDERRVADYFVVAGLPECPEEMGEFSQDGTHLKPTHTLPPIVDVTVIFQSLGEQVPSGYTCLTSTPLGHSANLTSGGWRSSEAYLCYKRGYEKPPLVDIGVIYDGKERIMADSSVVRYTPEGKPASVSSGSTTKTFVTFRRAPERMPCNQLVVTDICVIVPGKGEDPPHAFCLIDKSLNKSLMGLSGAYICYKKSMHRPTLVTYKPGVLARYPRTDRSYFPFPETVPLFCLPMGATVESWPAEAAQPKPVFSTFVLTVSDASEKVYGSAVTFYERIPDDNLSSEQRETLKLEEEGPTLKSVHANKCICLLSHWPFFDTFERFLKFLYSMTCNGPHDVPVERYISYFLEDVPFPSPKRPRILVQLSADDRVVLTQPEDLPLPRSGAGFCQLLSNLGPDNCMQVLLLALMEQKLLVHSLRPDVLTAVAEAISMIIFPFKWQCPYIPLCPLGLAGVLHAPVPFLIGVDSRFFDLYDPPSDVNCVDLDTNSITVCEERRGLTPKLLPKKAARLLQASLKRLCNKLRYQIQMMHSSAMQDQPDDGTSERDFLIKRKEQELELEIQEAFLHFMSSVLKGYRSYLLPITKAPTAGTTDPSSLFDLQGFVRSRDKAHHKFFSLIMKTQMFIRFIEERSFVSDMDASLAFFDECTEKVDSLDEPDAPLIELDDSHKSERTVFIAPPEPIGLPPGATYNYRGFVLNPLLFSQKEMKHFLGRDKDSLLGAAPTPGSPVAKRTKHEIRSAQKLARKFADSPSMWAKCLLSTCYSLWFIHLPSHTLQFEVKPTCLQKAYDLLVRINKLKVQPTDEVCYRVVMQLCGLYSLPVLAVKLLFLMKRSGMQPNAITYGFYNRAVLEAAWPSDMITPSQLLWNKLRNVILGVALFRKAGRKKARRKLSLSVDNADRVSLGGVSRTSVESANSSSHDSAALRNSKEVLVALQEQDKTATSSAATTAGSDAGYGSLCDPKSTSRGCLHEHEIGDIPHPPLPTSPISSSCNTPSTCDAALLEAGFISGIKDDIVKKSEQTLGPLDIGASTETLRPRLNSSIVKPTTPLTPTVQTPFESSAGLLMAGGPSDGASKTSHHPLGERRSIGTSDNNARRRHGSSGSSNEFARLRHEHRLAGPGGAAAGISAADTTDCFKMLRSESFANDAQILEKLSQLKVVMQEEEDERRAPSKIIGVSNGPYSKAKAKLGAQAGRSESQDLEEAVMNYMSEEDMGTNCNNTKVTPVKHKHGVQNRLPSIGRSPHSPARMPVTENDPLGALNGPDEEEEEEPKRLPPSVEQSPSRSWVVAEEGAGGPVLFKDSSRHRRAKTEEEGRTFHPPVMRSATYHQGLGSEDSVAVSSDPGDDASMDDIYPDDNDKKMVQRSSTLPVSPSSAAIARGVASSPSVASSLSSLSSSFKLPFRRYSPGRLSLRKPDLRLGTQMFENAQIAFTHFSPGSLAGKRSNEIIMGLKSVASTAATSMVKKFDEIKEVISANATPVKGATLIGVSSHEGSVFDDDEYGAEERRRTSAPPHEFSPFGSVQQYSAVDYWSNNFLDLFSGSDGGSRKGSATNLNPNDVGSNTSLHTLLAEKIYVKREEGLPEPVALELRMTTCSKCHNCSCIVYDEEIMAGWVPDDSNLNTECQHCKKWMVPLLTVNILDFREQPSNNHVPASGSTHSLQEIRPSNLLDPNQDCLTSSPHQFGVRNRSRSESQLGESLVQEQSQQVESIAEPVALEPITVPYLNPLVLRKEVESILDNEGDVALTRHNFVDEHPIIYWNLVWIFQRIDVDSHLPQLCLQADSVNRGRELHPSWSEIATPGVLVRCMWDNPRLYDGVGTPMYVLWQQPTEFIEKTSVSRATMQQVISGVKCNDLLDPLKKCVAERKKLKEQGIVRRYSIYRDILFLAFAALGRDNIDQLAFDEEYRSTFGKMSAKDLELYQDCDQPLSTFTICCRHYFKELEL